MFNDDTMSAANTGIEYSGRVIDRNSNSDTYFVGKKRDLKKT